MEDSLEVASPAQGSNQDENRSVKEEPSSCSRPLPGQNEQQEADSHEGEEREVACSHAQVKMEGSHSHNEGLSEEGIAHSRTEDSPEVEVVGSLLAAGCDRSMEQGYVEHHWGMVSMVHINGNI